MVGRLITTTIMEVYSTTATNGEEIITIIIIIIIIIIPEVVCPAPEGLSSELWVGSPGVRQ